METNSRPTPAGTDKLEKGIEKYFEACESAGRIPTLTGLALELGFGGRRAMEDTMNRGKGKKARMLQRARTRIEEENIRALYRRETSAGAKFVLQSEFGYSDREEQDMNGVIQVKIEKEV